MGKKHWWSDLDWVEVNKDRQSQEFAPNGTTGLNGGNKGNQESYREPSFTLDEKSLMLEYKEFIYSSDSVFFPVSAKSENFIKKTLPPPQTIDSLEDAPIYFSQHLLLLENVNLQLKNKKLSRDEVSQRMIPKYESLLNDLDSWVKNTSNGTALNDSHRKILSLVYSTLLGQLRTLRHVWGTPIIVNVAEYLESVTTRINEYTEKETKLYGQLVKDNENLPPKKVSSSKEANVNVTLLLLEAEEGNNSTEEHKEDIGLSLKDFYDLNNKVSEAENELMKLFKEREEFINKVQQGQSGTEEEKTIVKNSGTKALDTLKRISNAVTVVYNLGADIYKKAKDNDETLKQIGDFATQMFQQQKALENYKESVNNLVRPFTSSVLQDLNDAARSMEGKSGAFLRVKKWQVKKTLKQYNTFLQDFSEAFPQVSRQYSDLVVRLEEAITLAIDLHEFIEQYNEQMQFADYIANINCRRSLDVTLEPKYAAIYNKMDLALKGSLILSEWDSVIQSFQQWVFPFSKEFQEIMSISNIPNYLAPTIQNSTQVSSTLVPDIANRLSKLKTVIQQYKSASFPAVDNQLILTDFNSDQKSTVPFGIIDSETNDRKITDLLSGKKVTFAISPDFTYTRQMSAVKFRIAEFVPKAKHGHETIQSQLNDYLDKLRVQMTHSGISKYIYDNSDFEMVGGSLQFEYNFEKDAKGERLGRNNVYAKVQSGDVFLSPYTLWTVQLLKARDELPFDFEELAKLAPFVDLELTGVGSFVRPTAVSPMQVGGQFPISFFTYEQSNLPYFE